jgi:hypothetical protein
MVTRTAGSGISAIVHTTATPAVGEISGTREVAARERVGCEADALLDMRHEGGSQVVHTDSATAIRIGARFNPRVGDAAYR